METVTEMSTVKPTGLTNHAFTYLWQIVILRTSDVIFPLLVILMLIYVKDIILYDIFYVKRMFVFCIFLNFLFRLSGLFYLEKNGNENITISG